MDIANEKDNPTYTSLEDAGAHVNLVDEVDRESICSNNELLQTSSINREDKVTNSGSIYGLPTGHVPAYRAVFLISNAALGAGLLNFPQAYMKAGGIPTALSLQLSLLFFIIGAFIILARCADRYQASTYQDIILFVLGNRFRNFSQICILIYFFGTAITYIIIIGEQLSSVLQFISGHHGEVYTNKKFLFVIFSLVFLLPLCIPRRLKALSYTSFFGGVGAFFITCVIVYKYFGGHYKPNPDDPPIVADWKSAFSALPVICFGFQCHVSSVVVYSELKNRSAGKFFWCTFVAMIVCVLTYSFCGSFGYKTFGKSTNSDIMTNYDNNDVLINIARVAILIILLSSFSIVTFCARTVIDGIIVRRRNYGPYGAEQTERRRRVIITLSWFVCILLLALVVPNISVAITVISGVASLFIFTFPGLCLLKSINLQEDIQLKKLILLIVSIIYLIVGSFIFGLVTMLAIQDIMMKNM